MPPRRRLVFLALYFVLALLCQTCFASTGRDQRPDDMVIGIDLGTTYSCVGVYRAGRVEVIANSQGDRVTPSWVGFRGDERLIGNVAKRAFHTIPSHTVFGTKRLIGRMYDDPELKEDFVHWPFQVINSGGKPIIRVRNRGAVHSYTPEEISAMILLNLKETAERFLGHPVSQAVITVPAYFNDAQRQATKDAGAIAGLNVIRIVNEPTAAAIAYGLDKRGEQSRIMVFDLGGGTFDVSILSVDNGAFEVLATAGHSHLGGEDFDIRLVRHFVREYKATTGIDISKDHRTISKLKKEVENAKRILSTELSTTIEIESFHGGKDFSSTLTRAKFEHLNIDLFRAALKPVDRVLRDAQLSKQDIDHIVLVGGSTRIPKVRELLQDYFGGKAPSSDINPDEAVAIGASIHAAVISGHKDFEEVTLGDVCPHTIGVETTGGVFSPFIRRNTALPAQHTEVYSTVADNQPTVLIRVFEGDSLATKDNNLVGEFELTGLPPSARGIPQIEVKFELDVNGILSVSARDKFSGNVKNITVSSQQGRLSEEEVEWMAQDSANFAAEDEARRKRTSDLNTLQSYLWDAKAQLANTARVGASYSASGNDTLLSHAIGAAIDWLETHGATASSDELNLKLEELKVLVNDAQEPEVFIERQLALANDTEISN